MTDDKILISWVNWNAELCEQKNLSCGGVEVRVIKFRGKRIDKNEWAYGLLIESAFAFGNDSSKFYITDKNTVEDCAELTNAGILRRVSLLLSEVDTDTVGQFTGLQDKSGKDIYEADIVNVLFDLDKSIHVVSWMGDTDYPAFDLVPLLDTDSNGLSHVCCTDSEIEIIGNIYDNPELLEDAK